jgi:hypothetical protein
MGLILGRINWSTGQDQLNGSAEKRTEAAEEQQVRLCTTMFLPNLEKLNNLRTNAQDQLSCRAVLALLHTLTRRAARKKGSETLLMPVSPRKKQT